jgi:hypothetical protein
MSTFAWIDHSEKQRRQILEAIDLFREKDTRDELGIAGIRDAFSDMLFPGTGSLQTRARYFFFVPWMYLGFEAKGVPSAEVARRARDVEVKLINTLAESSTPPRPIWSAQHWCHSGSCTFDGIAADQGYFEVEYPDDGPTIDMFLKTRALAAFIMRLLTHFQGLGTVTAIDYKENSKVLDD